MKEEELNYEMNRITNKISRSVETDKGRIRISKGVRRGIEQILRIYMVKLALEKETTVEGIMESDELKRHLDLYQEGIKMLLDISTDNLEELPTGSVMNRFELLDLE